MLKYAFGRETMSGALTRNRRTSFLDDLADVILAVQHGEDTARQKHQLQVILGEDLDAMSEETSCAFWTRASGWQTNELEGMFGNHTDTVS